MATLKEMAEAHLSNVQKAIADLQLQKNKIDDEIKKLSDYLNEGISVLNEDKKALE
jgi:hypothetical protein